MGQCCSADASASPRSKPRNIFKNHANIHVEGTIEVEQVIPMERKGSLVPGTRVHVKNGDGVLVTSSGSEGRWVIKLDSGKNVMNKPSEIEASLPDDDLFEDLRTVTSFSDNDSPRHFADIEEVVSEGSGSFGTAISH